MTAQTLVSQFLSIYGGDDRNIRIFQAPGRINLIGEHIDYNGGHVFPAALEFSNTVIARPNGTDMIRLAVTSLPNRVDADLNALEQYKHLEWGNYQTGVAFILKQAGYSIVGCDLLYHGTVPYGAGLSSSASIEVATAIALAKLGGRESLVMEDIAVLCQKAENQYVGMNCGIMDQFISAVGRANHAILLDCASLKYEYVPMVLGDYTIVITNTNAPHKLTESQYNQRRSECDAALDFINKNGGDFQYLCDMDTSALLGFESKFKDPMLFRRARHCVLEEQRTLKAVDVLKNGDLKAFGQLLIEAHISMRDDYEATGLELDTAFEIALDIDGVIGSRMTGGGFGGCTISLVEKSKTEGFKEKMTEAYLKRIGYAPTFYQSSLGEGGREVLNWR